MLYVTEPSEGPGKIILAVVLTVVVLAVIFILRAP